MAAAQIARVRVARRRSAWERLSGQLTQLSPLRILERGYAIVSNAQGIVTNAALAPVESRIHVRLAKGELDAEVKG
jgi:exodeoxyribonuclease VII large subunit